jgi:DNA-binding NarL/FixJ family response regulator
MMVSARNPAQSGSAWWRMNPSGSPGSPASLSSLPRKDKPPLAPDSGTLEELLAQSTLEYLVVDLSSASGGLEILNSIRRARPNIRLIVIGPEGNDELVMDSIIAGARGYLELTAGPEMVRRAIDVVTGGSIWAPRRLLSKLIDRLLKVSDTSLINTGPRLTERERQVLEHILMARSNREIARQLGIEERTVKAHVGRLMRKTGSDNRIELSMRALHLPQVPRAKGQGGKESPPNGSLLKSK